MGLTIFPVLETERLHLRQFQPSDIDVVFKGLSHPEVIKYYGVSYKTLKDTTTQMNWFDEIWEHKTGIWWAITQKDKPEDVVGACGFNDWKQQHKNASIGYWLLPKYQRKGIMTEALQTIIKFGFETMDLHRIAAEVETENRESVWLLEKMHFSREGVLKDAEIKDGKYIDLYEYATININN